MAEGMNYWVRLAERCENATGPDREIDALIWLAFGDAKMRFSKASGGWAFFIAPFEDRQVAQLSNVKGCEAEAIKALGQYDFLPRPTASLDAITALIERGLPGWAWKVGTCSVSDDAWLTPDFNCPMHGDRLKRELGYDRMKPGDLLDVGIDIELRPSGRTALALCAAFCRAMNEKEANA